MLHAKESKMAELLETAIYHMVALGMNFAADAQRDHTTLPVDDIHKSIVPVLEYYVRFYKHDTEGLWKRYHEDALWRAAIRKQLLMEDKDEAGYWYYHVYDTTPNKMFSIYLSEHSSIALEKILEMFEYGQHQEFIALKLDLKQLIPSASFERAPDDVLTIIEERLLGKQLIHPHATARFIAYLSFFYYKKICTFVDELLLSENPQEKEFGELCKDQLQINDSSQLKLELQSS